MKKIIVSILSVLALIFAVYFLYTSYVVRQSELMFFEEEKIPKGTIGFWNKSENYFELKLKYENGEVKHASVGPGGGTSGGFPAGKIIIEAWSEDKIMSTFRRIKGVRPLYGIVKGVRPLYDQNDIISCKPIPC